MEMQISWPVWSGKEMEKLEIFYFKNTAPKILKHKKQRTAKFGFFPLS